MSHTALSELSTALDVLYNPITTSTITKEEANAWLEKFQHAPEAWTTCEAVLSDSNSRPEAKIFSAQTLRAKSISGFRHLDAVGRLSVRDSVLSLLHTYSSGPKVVITQLCLTLIAIAMQLRDWTNVVPQMIDLFGKPETANCLLEFLTALPVEVDVLGNRLPISDEDYRYQSDVLLTQNALEMLQLLTRYMQQSVGNAELQKQIFLCLASWCKEINVTALAENPLLGFSFDALQSDELFDDAVEVICEIIRGTREVQESMPVINVIYPRLVPLVEPLRQSKEDEDEDKLRGYLRIFAGAGEAYIPLIIQHYDAFRSIVEGILECTAFHDLDIVPKTFYFWYLLSAAVARPENEGVKAQVADTYRKLFQIMLKHLRYPEDESWTSEARDDFRNFRHDMGDVLKDCCVVLGAQETLERAYAELSKFVHGSTTPRWQDVEAPLFAIRTMGSKVDDNESAIMPQIMGLLERLPKHHKIQYCATLVIARYASWTRLHPEFIPYQLHLISTGFDNDEVVAAAAHALKYLCQECSEAMVKYLQELHPFYINALSSHVLTFTEVLHVTEAFAHVISAVQVPEEMLATLQMFCLPIAQKLHEISAKGPSANGDDVKVALDSLDQLAVFFQFVRPRPKIPADKPHPVVTVYDAVWPIFDSLITHLGDRPLIADSVTHCLNYTVQVSEHERFFPTIPRLLARTVAAFETTGQGSYLWLAGRIAKEYAGASEVTASSMLESLEHLSGVVFKKFTTPGKSIEEIPGVVEDYFRMMTNFLSAAPRTLISSPLLNSVFQCALAAMELDQQAPVLAVLIFVRNLLAEVTPRTNPQNAVDPGLEPLRALIRAQGPALVNQLFKGLIYKYPKDLVTDVGMVVKILGDILPSETNQWMGELVLSLPPDHLTADEKAGFLRDAGSAMQDENIKRIRRVLSDFQTLYRRKNIPPALRNAQKLV